MLKSIVLLILVFSVLSTDQDKIQQALNGLFEQNGLDDPTTIATCFDEQSAMDTVVFIGNIIDQASKSQISALPALLTQIPAFGHTLPS